MKNKNYYLDETGKVKRDLFRVALLGEAYITARSIPQVLREFFDSEKFSTQEMGRFARESTPEGHLIEGTLALIHALGITRENAPNARIIEDYTPCNPSDPQLMASTWKIDVMMNWPLCTTLPSSRATLEQWLRT